MTARTRTRPTTPRDGPITIEGDPRDGGRVTGWPDPDCAWDDECPGIHSDGYLPWAIIRTAPDWYTALYSCDQGHAWTCAYNVVMNANDPAIQHLKLSPHRIVPSDTYFREHTNPPRPIQIELIDWSPVKNN